MIITKLNPNHQELENVSVKINDKNTDNEIETLKAHLDSYKYNNPIYINWDRKQITNSFQEVWTQRKKQ